MFPTLQHKDGTVVGEKCIYAKGTDACLQIHCINMYRHEWKIYVVIFFFFYILEEVCLVEEARDRNPECSQKEKAGTVYISSKCSPESRVTSKPEQVPFNTEYYSSGIIMYVHVAIIAKAQIVFYSSSSWLFRSLHCTSIIPVGNQHW